MILADAEATAALGRALARAVQAGDVVLLQGPLGAGKTSLARELLAGLGHAGEVPSPTFAIVQPYEALDPPVWHADLYRLDDPEELQEIGLDEAEAGVLIVEWPERAGPKAFPNALRLVLEPTEDGARRLTADVPPSWKRRWPLPR
jgi:tRNA threonylcarbamoyladenosine biosynthesis protein TsaE